MDTFDNIPVFLQKHPLLGMLCGITGSALHWIDVLSPILSFIGLVLGVGIAAITLHLKMIEWKAKRKQRKEKKHEIK